MGNKASAKFGCISAPLDDGEISYNSINSQSHSSISTNSICHLTDSEEISSSECITYHAERKRVKILFLDVDGVLNNGNTVFDERSDVVEDELLQLLKLIIIKTNCKIVLSTTWRIHEHAKRSLMHSIKTRIDLDPDSIVIGSTKDFKGRQHRTYEIFTYLKENEHLLDVVSWVAIDDLSLDKYDIDSAIFMDGHFVKTNPKKGMTPQNAIECIQILNANDYEMNSYRY